MVRLVSVSHNFGDDGILFLIIYPFDVSIQDEQGGNKSEIRQSERLQRVYLKLVVYLSLTGLVLFTLFY